MNKKLFITGGAGFIGSNFIRYILNKYQDYDILNFDKLTYAGNLDNLKDVENDSRYKFIKGDICDQELLEIIFKKEKIDFIINFAAESHVDRSILDSHVFIKTNILGVNNLLEIARKHSVEKFMQISTDEVYGSIKEGSFTEESRLLPNSPYSASKAGADLLVRSYYETFKLPVLITRSANNFGPYQYPEKLIPLFITNILENKKVPIYGEGKNIRSWIYVLDNCSAIDAVLHRGEIGEMYNIAANDEKTNMEITKAILKEFNKDGNWIEYVKDRLGHDFRYSLKTERVNGLGWKPEYTFQEALKETIGWYNKNEQWWKKLKSNKSN